MLKALGTREARAMPGTRRKTHWRPGSDSVRSPSEDVDPNAASLAVLEAAAAPSNQAEPAVWIPEKSLIGCQPSTKGRPQRCLRRLQVTRRSCDPVPRPFDDLESAAAPLAVLAADTARPSRKCAPRPARRRKQLGRPTPSAPGGAGSRRRPCHRHPDHSPGAERAMVSAAIRAHTRSRSGKRLARLCDTSRARAIAVRISNISEEIPAKTHR